MGNKISVNQTTIKDVDDNRHNACESNNLHMTSDGSDMVADESDKSNRIVTFRIVDEPTEQRVRRVEGFQVRDILKMF